MNSKLRRFVASLAIPFVVAGSVFGPINEARAAVPVLAIAWAVDFGAALVLRSAGRVAIQSIGVAANDASWLTAGSTVGVNAASILAFIGLGAYSSDAGVEQYAVQVKPGSEMPKSPNSPTGSYGGYSNPLNVEDPNIFYTGLDKVCAVDDSNGIYRKSTDTGSYPIDEFEARCNAFISQYRSDVTFSYEERLDQGNPVLTLVDGWYVKHAQFYLYYQGNESLNDAGSTVCIGTTTRCVTQSFREAKDGVKRVILNEGGTGFKADPKDGDWEGDAAKGFNSTSITLYGKNANQQDTRVDINRNGQQTQIAATTQVSASQVLQRSMVVTADGKIDTVYQAVADGLIDTVPAPGGGTSTGGNQNIQFPSDYARQGEAGQAADKVATAIENLGKASASLDDPMLPEWADPWGDAFNGLRGWSMPNHSSQCPVGSFNWDGKIYTIDSHCQLVVDHWGPLSASMTAVWFVAALFIVLRA